MSGIAPSLILTHRVRTEPGRLPGAEGFGRKRLQRPVGFQVLQFFWSQPANAAENLAVVLAEGRRRFSRRLLAAGEPDRCTG